MSVEQIIRKKLTVFFNPVELEIRNDSHRHANHEGSPDNGESHFTIKIVAINFAGKSRIECHRMVTEVLADELAGPIHALSIRAKSADKAGSS